MNKIKNLYESLWKLFIRPSRIHYYESDIGPYEYFYDEKKIFIKRVFKLHNILNEEFHVSIYLPKNKKEDFDIIVYCHTQNGNRVEGNFLYDYAFKNNFGICLFDFRANGASTGKYITLGVLESLDLNSLLFFLKNEIKVKRICLWGRSMGGASIIFFLSKIFRKTITEHLKKFYKKDKVFWVSRKIIDCVILDSVFSDIFSSSTKFISSKSKKIPNFLVEISLNLINSSIKEKINISLNEINPKKYIKDLEIPCFMFIGKEDELVDLNEFMFMYKLINHKLKKIKLINGNHTEERDENILYESMDFINYIFKNKNNINNKTNEEDNLTYYDKPEDIFKKVKESTYIYNEENTNIFNRAKKNQSILVVNKINSINKIKSRNMTQLQSLKEKGKTLVFNFDEKDSNNTNNQIKTVQPINEIQTKKNPRKKPQLFKEEEEIPIIKELNFRDKHEKFFKKNKFETKKKRNINNIKLKFNKEENNVEINPEYIKNGEIYYNNNEINSISNINEKIKKGNNFFSNRLDIINELNYKEEEVNDLKLDYKINIKKIENLKENDKDLNVVFKLVDNKGVMKESLALINGIDKISIKNEFYKTDEEDKILYNYLNK